MKITDLHQGVTDKLDYTLNFASWLGLVSDTIASVAWSIPADLTASNQSNTTTTMTTYLTGGKMGETYTITGTITTAASPARIKAASFSLKIEADV
jgi:hypothetical protein